jgi:hypothetical protein
MANPKPKPIAPKESLPKEDAKVSSQEGEGSKDAEASAPIESKPVPEAEAKKPAEAARSVPGKYRKFH